MGINYQWYSKNVLMISTHNVIWLSCHVVGYTWQILNHHQVVIIISSKEKDDGGVSYCNCQKQPLHHHHLQQTTIATKIPASPNSKAVLTEASLGFSETAVASSLSHLRDQFTIIFEPWSICHDPDCHATSAEQINSVFISILESWSWLSWRRKGILPVCILPIPGWTIGMIRPVFGWRTFRIVDELWT